MSTGRSNNPLYDERGQFIVNVPGAAGNATQPQEPAAPPTTYESLKGLISGLGDDAQIGLNIPVVNPAAEAEQNRLLADLAEASEATPFFTPAMAPFVTGLSPTQEMALLAGVSGIGSYQPYLDLASSYYSDAGATADQLSGLADTASGLGAAATGAAQPSVGLGMGLASDIAGIAGGLEAGGAKAFDPTSVSDFMSPFTQDVIDQSLADIQRESDIARNRQRAEATRAGGFGGSRAAVMDAELDRATLEQKAQTAAELRRAGFESAASRAQKAFEDQQARFLSANQLGLGSLAEAGRLGLGAGELGLKGITTGLAGTELGAGILGDAGGMFSDLGGAQSDLAARVSGLGALDIETLTALGGLEAGAEQRLNEALYGDQLAAIMDPYKAIQIRSDILKGVPYTQTALSVGSRPPTPQPNTGAALTGAGIAALGYGLENLGRGQNG